VRSEIDPHSVTINLKHHGLDERTQNALKNTWPPSPEILTKFQDKIFRVALFMLEVYLDRDESRASNKSVLSSEKFMTKTVQELHGLIHKHKL
jgi:hypothetical protein